MTPFPIFLNNLHEQRSVVIGGNHEAERKTGDLLEADANVTLIAPDPTDTVKEWAEAGAIEWIERDYRPGDLEGAFLAIVSETNPEKTHPIWKEAKERNILFNAMDDIPHCNFFNGSYIRQGPLVISISTTGAAPTLSVRLREWMEDEFGPEYEEFLHIMKDLRDPMAEHHPDFDERRDLWYEIVDSDALDLLRQGRRADALDRIESIVGTEVVSSLRAPAHKDAETGWINRLTSVWSSVGLW
ncbi:MAG: bifunctional precorrin-2 dehydrogenase/sirohydrochlorin ferrochelatase [Salinibacter sp.]